jgi:hypothetical protein
MSAEDVLNYLKENLDILHMKIQLLLEKQAKDGKYEVKNRSDIIP